MREREEMIGMLAGIACGCLIVTVPLAMVTAFVKPEGALVEAVISCALALVVMARKP